MPLFPAEAKQAVMGELCPQGWRAQITVHGQGASMPADVELERIGQAAGEPLGGWWPE